MFLSDALKGFAAILVVLGHVTQFCFNSTYETNFLFKIPYSFHMMLFFFISGYLSDNKKTDIQWIKSKAKSLLTPWIIWTYIFILKHNICISEFPVYLFSSLVWFLPALFMAHLYLFISSKIKFPKFINLLLYLILLCLIFVVTKNHIIKMVLLHFPYYIMGVLFHRYNWYEAKLIKNNGWIFIIIYIVSMIMYGFPNYSDYVKWLPFNNKISLVILKLHAHILVPTIAILANWFIFHKLQYLTNIFKFFGKYTIDLYLIGGLLIQNNYHENIYLNFVLNFIYCILIPIIISEIFNGNLKRLYSIILGK